MLKFVPDHLDQYKTKKKCNRTIPENSGILESFANQYKTQEMCVKAADICAHALESFSDRYR